MIGILLNQRYRLESELGQGGMGIVYRAYDTLLDRQVAVKIVNQTILGKESKARLQYEAQAAASLNHPNIVVIHDAGEAQISSRTSEKTDTPVAGEAEISTQTSKTIYSPVAIPFIVMEMVIGTSLHEYKPQGLAEIITIARQVCSALGHAHSHGLIHRDLKPENILIGADGNVKLADFGLARSVASRLTTEGMIFGSVFYLAPELALSQPYDGRADLYALGVILYELVAGRLPFLAEDPLAVISQHVNAPVVPPSTYNAEIPQAFESLILALLNKQPQGRPASAEAVLERLQELEERDALPSPLFELPVLDRIMRGRLVGRQAELALLRELWSHVRAGHCHLALISGEPGVGKTRLATELMVYAKLSGATVLRGGSYEYEASTPYLPFIEALRSWVHDQNSETLKELLASFAPELARLAPEIESKIGPLPPNPSLPPNEERLRLFDHMARFFQCLSQERGLLLFIDDLHWVDSGSFALLQYLIRFLRNERLLVLATFRDDQLSQSALLTTALVEWNRERLDTRIPLDRLQLAGTAEMLAELFGMQSVSGEFAQAVYRETEGNPFFIEEAVKYLIEQGQIYREGGRWERKEVADLAIPQSVREAISRRINRLSPACVEMLHQAAALGKLFSFAELAAVSTGEEDELLDTLDEATSAQLVHPESGEGFSFTHDKIREVLYEELNPIRRRRLHQRIGEALERLYSAELNCHFEDLAHHFSKAGDLQNGLLYSIKAAEAARRLYAHEDALMFYEQAAEFAQAMDQTEMLANIWEGIGDVHWVRGLQLQPIQPYLQALELTTNAETRAALKAKIGKSYAMTGVEQGLDYLNAAMAELNPETQTKEMAQTLAMLGRYHHYRMAHTLAIEYLEQAKRLAEPVGDPETLINVYGYLAGAYQHMARFDQSIEWANRCIALGKDQHFPFGESLGYEYLAEIAYIQGDWLTTKKYAALDLQVGEDIGSQDRMAWAIYCHSQAFLGLGDLKTAESHALEAQARAEAIGESRLVVWNKSLLVLIQTDLGDEDAAQTAGQQVVAAADELGQVVLQCWARSALAYLYIQQENWEAAARLLDECESLLAGGESRIVHLFIDVYRAETRLEEDRLDEAMQILDSFLALAQESGARHYEAIGWRTLSRVLLSRQAREKAADALNRAIAIFEELGSQIELGRALYQRSLLQDKIGEEEAAHADLSRALEIFEITGAVRDRVRAKRLPGK